MYNLTMCIREASELSPIFILSIANIGR